MLRLGLERVRFDPERGRKALEDGATAATDVAEALAQTGVPFRTAYKLTGALVRKCMEAGLPLSRAPLDLARQIDPRFTPEVLRAADAASSVTRKKNAGGRVPSRSTRRSRICKHPPRRPPPPSPGSPAWNAPFGLEGGAAVKRDFLQLSDLSPDEHRTLFGRARELKSMRRAGQPVRTLEGRSLLLLFEKASTRTRISFEAAIGQLGGNAITLPTADSQIARGETLEDTARVASRYVDAIMFRTHGDDRLRAFARASTVPVINGLSDGGHPVQVLADLFTVEEKLGKVAGKTVAFVGDCASNMALSFCEAAPSSASDCAWPRPRDIAPRHQRSGALR